MEQFFVDFESSLVKWSKGVQSTAVWLQGPKGRSPEDCCTNNSCQANYMLDPILSLFGSCNGGLCFYPFTYQNVCFDRLFVMIHVGQVFDENRFSPRKGSKSLDFSLPGVQRFTTQTEVVKDTC